MKKIIAGKLYSTDTALFVTAQYYPNSVYCVRTERLYFTKTAKWLLHNLNLAGVCSAKDIDNSKIVYERLELLSEGELFAWIEDKELDDVVIDFIVNKLSLEMG